MFEGSPIRGFDLGNNDDPPENTDENEVRGGEVPLENGMAKQNRPLHFVLPERNDEGSSKALKTPGTSSSQAYKNNITPSPHICSAYILKEHAVDNIPESITTEDIRSSHSSLCDI